VTASAFLGTYKTPLHADLDGRPRVGTLRVPLDAAFDGMDGNTIGTAKVRVEPLTADVIFHTDGHDGCPATVTADIATVTGIVVGQITCCDTCRP
jgi:hypothetical protein